MGLYHIFMSDLLNLYPRNQIYYVRMNELQQDRVGVMMKLTQFLTLGKIAINSMKLYTW